MKTYKVEYTRQSGSRTETTISRTRDFTVYSAEIPASNENVAQKKLIAEQEKFFSRKISILRVTKLED